ncbi:MAG: RloB family protein [Enterobacteriaceae bacterium]
MGSEDLFHKRKAKTARGLQRKKARRAAYEKLLIVCEGEKTEPNYFAEARDYYSLNTVNVEIRGDCRSDPMKIVDFAQQRYREENDAGDPFDRVFCVFDKDQHATYTRALNVLASATPDNTYFPINSVPCFEYWLLLHFIYSTRSYTALPDNSSGKQVLAELKNYLPDYEKGAQTIFSNLVNQLEQARHRAERALQESERNQTDNPSTRVHELIQVLQKLKG